MSTKSQSQRELFSPTEIDCCWSASFVVQPSLRYLFTSLCNTALPPAILTVLRCNMKCERCKRANFSVVGCKKQRRGPLPLSEDVKIQLISCIYVTKCNWKVPTRTGKLCGCILCGDLMSKDDTQWAYVLSKLASDVFSGVTERSEAW